MVDGNRGRPNSRGAIEAELRTAAARRPAGTRLPSVRELMARHRAGPATVEAVLARLSTEGLIEARPGEGTFVAATHRRVQGDVAWQTVALGHRPVPGEALGRLIRPDGGAFIDLAGGYPDASLWATALLSRAAARAARRSELWARSDPKGVVGLRTWFARDIGCGFTADDVVIVSGGQAALATLFSALAAPPGDAVIMESPSYLGAIEAARAAGLVPTPVPVDDDGVQVEHLDAALRTSGAPLVYLQPLLSNPSGATLSAERRGRLLEVVRRHRAFVIEDDYARYLAEPGSPPPLAGQDADGHVVHVRSLTKAAAPALRVAAVAGRGPVLRRIANARLVDDFFVSPLLQEIALDVVSAAGWPRHLTAVRRQLALRRHAADVALATVAAVEATRPAHGGFLRWLRLTSERDDTTVVETMRSAVVALTAGRDWFCGEPPGTYLRLSLAAVDAGQLGTAVALLAGALASA